MVEKIPFDGSKYMEFDENSTSKIGTIVVIFAPCILVFLILSWFIQGQVTILEGVLFVLWTYAGSLSVTLGLHRLMTHESFRASHRLKLSLMVVAITVLQGHIRNWILFHRRHHRYADQVLSLDKRIGDMSSPRNMYVKFGRKLFGTLMAFLYSHLLWMLDKSIKLEPREYGKNRKESQYAHIDDDPDIAWVDGHYVQIIFLSLVWTLLVGLLEGLIAHHGFGCINDAIRAFLVIGVLRNFVVNQDTFLINSWTHMKGRQDYYVGEDDMSQNPYSPVLPSVVTVDQLKLALVKLRVIPNVNDESISEYELERVLAVDEQNVLLKTWNVVLWMLSILFEVLTLGEFIHNTHHKFQASPNFALERGQLDLGYRSLQGFALLGEAEIYTWEIPSMDSVLKARRFKTAIDKARRLAAQKAA